MTVGTPPPSPPERYVWVDEKRVESIEAALARLTHAAVDQQVSKDSTRGRFFTAFSKIDTIEQRTEAFHHRLLNLEKLCSAIAVAVGVPL